MNSVQPKFKDCQYDYDKHPGDLRAWIILIGNLVRSLEFGLALELFLDSFLNRVDHSSSTQPSFLDDPRLNLPTTTTPQEANATEATSEPSTATTPNVLHRLQQEVRPHLYSDLSSESQQLDVVIYTALCTILRGGMLKIISELRGSNARYTFVAVQG